MDKAWVKKKFSSDKQPSKTSSVHSSKDKGLGFIDEKEAEHRIQSFIILQAWRHQKEKNHQLENTVKLLSGQVESLHLQLYTLRQLLDAEKIRVVNINSDLQKIISALEVCKHEKKSLSKEKEQLEHRITILEDRLMNMENENKNQRNELMTAKSEAQSWEKQLEKEREKWIKMKDERSFFDEVRFKENLLVWPIRSFEQISRMYSILQSKPDNPALPWDETRRRLDPPPEMSMTLQKIQKTAQAVVIIGNPVEMSELKALLARVERRTLEEDVRSEEVEKSILGKTKNPSLLKGKRIIQNTNSGPQSRCKIPTTLYTSRVPRSPHEERHSQGNQSKSLDIKF